MGATIIAGCFAISGLLNALIMVMMGQYWLRPSYLPNHSERELRMARWRQVSSAVLMIWFMGNMALFFGPPTQVLYVKLASIAMVPQTVLMAMNQRLISEAAKVWRERRRASKSRG
ncbi:MAG: hypothetical protein ACYC63_09540 [Armatimonadota bacterium]